MSREAIQAAVASMAPSSTALSRRCFLGQTGVGLGRIALASLLTGALDRPSSIRAATTEAADPLAARPGHFVPKAKAVIHLFMAGAPSHLDLFDFKPALAKYEGRSIPPEVIGGQRYAFIRSDAAAMGPRFKFAKHGNCGTEIAEVLPHLATVVDDICLVRSMRTDQFNHAPAQIFFNTGFSQPGRPSLGSWALYGLGAETQNLPNPCCANSATSNAETPCWLTIRSKLSPAKTANRSPSKSSATGLPKMFKEAGPG